MSGSNIHNTKGINGISPVDVCGVNVYPFNSVDELIDAANSLKRILVAINAEKIVNSTPTTRGIINSNIGYCDGVGAVKALKQKGCGDVPKIPGCELWLNIIDRFHASHSFYLLGSKQAVIDATVEKLRGQYPDLNIVGYRNGYLKSDADRRAVIDEVVHLKPDVVFVAMGSPRQELLMSDMQARHQAIYQGLGGSFDVYSGNVERAPQWWLDHNLEFLHRFVSNPKRFKRLIPIWKFALRLLFHRI